MRPLIILLSLFLLGCPIGGASSSKIIPISVAIDGKLGEYLEIKEDGKFEIIINEDKLSYEIKVTLQPRLAYIDEDIDLQNLYLEVFDSEEQPSSYFDKFNGPSKYDNELEALLRGEKGSMIATFSCNASTLQDFAEILIDINQNNEINTDKIVDRMKSNLRKSKIKYFMISSY